MKTIKVIEEVACEGLTALLGQRITVFCMNYIYTGDLIGVNETCIKLANTKIVYETGALDQKDWKDAQKLPNEFWYVQVGSIESFGILK